MIWTFKLLHKYPAIFNSTSFQICAERCESSEILLKKSEMFWGQDRPFGQKTFSHASLWDKVITDIFY